MAKTKEAENQQLQKSAEPVGLVVTLIQKGSNTYDVLEAGGEPLRCKCGRPVQASLHNVSVKERLEPCSKVVPVGE